MYRSQIGLKVKIRQSGLVLEHLVYRKKLLHLGNWGIGCVGVNGVCADDWLVELTIVASNGVA